MLTIEIIWNIFPLKKNLKLRFSTQTATSQKKWINFRNSQSYRSYTYIIKNISESILCIDLKIKKVSCNTKTKHCSHTATHSSIQIFFMYAEEFKSHFENFWKGWMTNDEWGLRYLELQKSETYWTPAIIALN